MADEEKDKIPETENGIVAAAPDADAECKAAAEKISEHLEAGEKDEAAAFLASLDTDALVGALRLLDTETRVDAFLLLDRSVALDLIRETDDDPETSFLSGLDGTDVSRIVDDLYSDDESGAVTDLPPFLVQRLLTHGDERSKSIIEGSITGLVERKQLALLKSVLVELNPVDIAEILDDFKTEDLLKVYRILPKDLASDVFVYLPDDVSQNMLTALSDVEAGRLIDDLYADDAADLLEEMPSMVVKKLLAKTKPETRAAVNHLLQYKEDSAGSIMTVEFVDLKEYYTAAQAIEVIRKTGLDKETVNTCFVLDAQRRLLGTVTLRRLVLAAPGEKVGDIMDDNVIIVRTDTDQEEVAKLFKRYDLTSMPVCDSENRLVGIVTVDDIVDIIEEETEEDFSKMAAMAPIEDTYLKTSAWKHARGRVLWLLFLMISATFTGLVINGFEAQLSTFLYSFTPLLMGTAGNCGSQASTTVIRALALDQISTKDFFKVSMKEGLIALICSSILAVANTVRVILMYWWTDYNKDNLVLKVSLVLGVTLILIMVIAQVLGSVLPIIAKKIRVDPALMSSPVIATIMDTLSILIYCGIIVLCSLWFNWGTQLQYVPSA